MTLDLTCLRPTFAFLLRIDDPEFMYSNQIKTNSENQDIDFVTLSEFEDKVKLYDSASPLMPESAGVYDLLKKNRLFREICPGQTEA